MRRMSMLGLLSVIVALAGCNHKGTYAVDMIDTAEKNAIAAVQAPEKIVFEDDGAALFPGTVTQRTAGTTPPVAPTTTTPDNAQGSTPSDTQNSTNTDGNAQTSNAQSAADQTTTTDTAPATATTN